MSNNVKTIMGITAANVKTVNGIAAANVKTVMSETFELAVAQATNSISTNLASHSGSERRAWGIANCYDPDTNQVIHVHGDNRNNNYSTAYVVDSSGTVGSAVVIQSEGEAFHNAPVYNTVDDRIMITYLISASTNKYAMVGGSVGTRTITVNTSGRAIVEDGAGGAAQGDMSDITSYNPASNVALVAFENGGESGDPNYIAAATIDTSDNSITVGTSVEFVATTAERYQMNYDEDIQKTVLVYYNADPKVGARVVSLGGTGNRTITLGTEALYHQTSFSGGGGSTKGNWSAYDTTNNVHHVFLFNDGGGSGFVINYFTVSGTTVSWAAEAKEQAFQGNTTRASSLVYVHNRNKLLGIGGQADIAYHLYTFDGTDYTYDSTTGVVNIETGLESSTAFVGNNGMDGVDHSAFGKGHVFTYSSAIGGNGDNVRMVGIEVGT